MVFSSAMDEMEQRVRDPAADDDEGKPSEREESGREADERELPEKDAASSAVEAEPDASAAAGARSNGTSAKSKPTVTVAEAQKSYEDKGTGDTASKFVRLTGTASGEVTIQDDASKKSVTVPVEVDVTADRVPSEVQVSAERAIHVRADPHGPAAGQEFG